MTPVKNIRTITFDGGCLCLDFVNTVSSRRDEPMTEYLENYEDILILSERQGILTEKALQVLHRLANQHPEEAKQVLAESLVIRENLFALFWAIASGSTIPVEVLKAFNANLSLVFSHQEIYQQHGKLEVGWKTDPEDLYLPVRMALKSAYEVTTTQELRRIKECSACGWLFLDKSKNNARRWCDMQACGSIEKSKRYYHRKKQQS